MPSMKYAMEYQGSQFPLWAAEAADNDIVEPSFGLMDYGMVLVGKNVN